MLDPIRINMDSADPLSGLAPLILGMAMDLVSHPKPLVESETFASKIAFHVAAQALTHIQAKKPQTSSHSAAKYSAIGE